MREKEFEAKGPIVSRCESKWTSSSSSKSVSREIPPPPICVAGTSVAFGTPGTGKLEKPNPGGGKPHPRDYGDVGDIPAHLLLWGGKKTHTTQIIISTLARLGLVSVYDVNRLFVTFTLYFFCIVCFVVGFIFL